MWRLSLGDSARRTSLALPINDTWRGLSEYPSTINPQATLVCKLRAYTILMGCFGGRVWPHRLCHGSDYNPFPLEVEALGELRAQDISSNTASRSARRLEYTAMLLGLSLFGHIGDRYYCTRCMYLGRRIARRVALWFSQSQS